MNITHEVQQAERRIRPFIRKTQLEPSLFYSENRNAHVFFKCENLQYTGSFKVRGALNKILSLSDEERSRGIVTASTGNHGAATAFALQKIQGQGIVFVPENADPSKTANIKRLGAEIRTYGLDSAQTEVYARQYAAERGKSYISPYNDPQVIGGQGTIGLELQQQLDPIDAVFAAVGGGGLISGIAGILQSNPSLTKPPEGSRRKRILSVPNLREVEQVTSNTQIIGCSPQNSQVMAQSVTAGKILDLPTSPTLSDGTAGGIEANAITFPYCRDLVDRYVSVTEAEIAESLRSFIDVHRMLIEGAAAVALAAFLKVSEDYAGKNVVIILCGGNISVKTLREIL